MSNVAVLRILRVIKVGLRELSGRRQVIREVMCCGERVNRVM